MSVQNFISTGAIQPDPNSGTTGVQNYISPGAIQPPAYVTPPPTGGKTPFLMLLGVGN